MLLSHAMKVQRYVKEVKTMRKDYFYEFWIVFMWILIIGFIAFEITLLCMYGDKPVDEIPTWVLWFLFRRR